MTKSKNTKRALWASLLSMFLCIAMLIGSTFAWFTDSVTSGKNKIVAGNLDVELEYRDKDGSWQTVGKDTELFRELEDDGATENLWEPGHTEVVYLRIRNAGTLALKYQLGVKVNGENPFTNVLGEENCLLSDYLVFGQAESESEVSYATRDEAWTAAGSTQGLGEYTKEEVLYPEGTEGKISERYVAMVVYMPTTVGNEANYRGDSVPSIDLGVNLVATQTPYESDSFDNQYDETATLPAIVSSSAELADAVKGAADGSTIMLNGDAILENPLSVSSDITLDLGTSNIINNNNKDGININANGKNVTIKATTGGVSMANQHCIAVNAKDSNIVVDGGNYSVVGTSNAYFMEDRSGGSNHVTIQNVTYNGNRGVQFSQSNNNVIDIKNCTFTTNGYSTIYIGGVNVCNLENVTVTGSQIYASDTKVAGELQSVINIKSGTYNCKLWASSGNSNCTISVTGGSFQYDPSQYVAEGYQAIKDSSSGMYVVTAKN